MLIHATGMLWFDRKNYERLARVFQDAGELHGSYDDWLESAVLARDQIEEQGIRVIRVDVDADTFLAWCADNRQPVNSVGRVQYASHVAWQLLCAPELEIELL